MLALSVVVTLELEHKIKHWLLCGYSFQHSGGSFFLQPERTAFAVNARPQQRAVATPGNIIF